MWQYSEATLNELRGLEQATVDGGEKEVREEDSEVHSRAAEVMAELRTARIHDGPLTCSISDGAGVEVAVHVVLAVRVEDRVKFAGCGHQVCLFVHIEQLPRAFKWPAEESRLGAGPVRVTHLLLGRSGQPVGWRGRVEPREKARNTVRRARRTAARVQRIAQGWHRLSPSDLSGFPRRRLCTGGTEVDLTASDALETRYASSAGAQEGRVKPAARVGVVESSNATGGDL